MIIKRCLANGVKIYPHKLDTVLKQYDKYKIPDEVLEHIKTRDLEDYVRGLYLSGCEMASDWKDGHNLLKKLGFTEKTRHEGHRVFISLEYR